MRRAGRTLAAALLTLPLPLLLAVVGCASQPSPDDDTGDRSEETTEDPVTETPRTAQMQVHTFGEDVRLGVGDTATFGDGGETFVVRFVGVEGDSRCPRGVDCIWEGEAEVELRIAVNQGDAGTMGEEELVTVYTRSTRHPDHAPAPVGHVRLVSLEPYPTEGVTLDPSDYMVTLRFTAAAPPSDGNVSDS